MASSHGTGDETASGATPGASGDIGASGDETATGAAAGTGSNKGASRDETAPRAPSPGTSGYEAAAYTSATGG